MASLITQATKDGASSAALVQLHTTRDIPIAGPGEVLVKFLASPINPLDMLVLTGKYPVKPKYQHEGQGILGFEGVAQVLGLGGEESKSALQIGDLVVPAQFGLGTWRSHAVLSTSALHKIATRPHDLVFASLLRISVSPAYCLVEDMRCLKPGDWIIQNAGTSVVAQFVTQFAALRGVKVIHVIRDRSPEELYQVRKVLLEKGSAAMVLQESELRNQEAWAELRKNKRVVLAIDAVYGDSGALLMQALSDGGIYVHLGFLGGHEGKLQLGSSELFGRRLTLRGFRGSEQMAARTPQEQASLLNWWVDLFNANKLQFPALGLSRIPLDASEGGQEALGAIRRAQCGKLGQRKQVLIFE